MCMRVHVCAGTGTPWGQKEALDSLEAATSGVSHEDGVVLHSRHLQEQQGLVTTEPFVQSPSVFNTEECRSTIQSAWTKDPARDLYFPRFKNLNFIENEPSCVFFSQLIGENLGLLERTWTLYLHKYNSGNSGRTSQRLYIVTAMMTSLWYLQCLSQ